MPADTNEGERFMGNEMLMQLLGEMTPEQMAELMAMFSEMQTAPGADQMTGAAPMLMDPAAMAEMTETLTMFAQMMPILIGSLLIGLLIWRIILGLVSRRVMKNRGGKGGFWWGFFLGFIGIIVEAVRPKE